MTVQAWLLGDPTRAPFLGHGRLRLDNGRARLCGAARVGISGGVVGAYRAARELEQALLEAASGPGDRYALLWRAWEALAGMPAEALGRDEGADLSLLLVAQDDGGICVAGVGMSAVFGLVGAELRPLAEGRHPLLAPPGRPARTPGVLNLDVEPEAVLGLPSHLDARPPQMTSLRALAGVRA